MVGYPREVTSEERKSVEEFGKLRELEEGWGGGVAWEIQLGGREIEEEVGIFL